MDQDDQTYFAKGYSLAKQGKYAKAIEAYQKAIKLKPKDAPAYYNMGIILAKQGKYADAIEAYQKAIKLKPKDAPAYYNMGISLAKQGKYADAIEAYQKAIKLKPEDAIAYIAYNNVGVSLDNQGKYADAIEAYQKAIKLKPEDATAYNNMGTSLANQGKYADAIEAFQKAISMNPKYILAYNNWGAVLKSQEKEDSAQELKVSSKNIIGTLSIMDSIKYGIAFEGDIAEVGDESIQQLKKVVGYSGFAVDEFVRENTYDLIIQLMIQLMISIHNFKVSLLLDDDESDNIYYQYTSLNTLKSMLRLSEASNTNNADINMRLYNTDYMNDPDEGLTLLTYLKIDRDVDSNDVGSNNASHSFIAALTPENQKDEIPMWRMYGDNNKGIVIGFKGLPVWQPRFENDQISTEKNLQSNQSKLPQLYKILYIDENDQNTSNSSKELTSIRNTLGRLLAQNKDDKFKETVKKFTLNQLGYARFLVKNARYSYEHEIRLLQMADSFNDAHYEKDNPKLYMKYSESFDERRQRIKLNIAEIIFGVDSSYPMYWAAIIKKKLGDNVKLRKTKIHFRSK